FRKSTCSTKKSSAPKGLNPPCGFTIFSLCQPRTSSALTLNRDCSRKGPFVDDENSRVRGRGTKLQSSGFACYLCLRKWRFWKAADFAGSCCRTATTSFALLPVLIPIEQVTNC